MASVFKDCTEVMVVKDLGEAIGFANREAKTGETVLFSPACSSFDMFRDYEERGEKFMELVKAL